MIARLVRLAALILMLCACTPGATAPTQVAATLPTLAATSTQAPTSAPSPTTAPSPTPVPPTATSEPPTATPAPLPTLLPTQTSAAPQPAATSASADLAARCASVVEGIRALRAPYSGDIPDHLTTGDGRKQGGEFDANTYFTVFQHLSLPPGKVLDWVQFVENIGAEPILYVRDASAPPFATYEEYETAGGTGSIRSPSQEALNEVVTDDSPEGYLELAILHLTAVQFYRWWHAGYSDDQVACNRVGLDAIAADVNATFSALLDALFEDATPSPEYRETMRAMGMSLDPYTPQATDALLQPVVVLDRETATVTISTFTKWGGLQRRTITFSRRLPHGFAASEPETVEPWILPIVF
jgi:hypothetical protein